MKNLVDILVEKLSIDNIVLDTEFPINGTFDNIIEFLKEQGFELIRQNGGIYGLFNSAKSKCFIYNPDPNDFRIWFADTSKEKISKKNPVFTYMNDTYEKCYTIYYINNLRKIEYIVENDKKEFLEELNKRFGW